MLTSTTPTTSATQKPVVPQVDPNQQQQPKVEPNQQQQPKVDPNQQQQQNPEPAVQTEPQPEPQPAVLERMSIGLLYYAVGAIAYVLMHNKAKQDIQTNKDGNGLFKFSMLDSTKEAVKISEAAGADGEEALKAQAKVNAPALEKAIETAAADENIVSAPEVSIFRAKILKEIDKGTDVPVEEEEEEEITPPAPTPVAPIAQEEKPIEQPTEEPEVTFEFLVDRLKAGAVIPIKFVLEKAYLTEPGRKAIIYALKPEDPNLQMAFLKTLAPRQRESLRKELANSTVVSHKDTIKAQNKLVNIFMDLVKAGNQILMDDLYPEDAMPEDSGLGAAN